MNILGLSGILSHDPAAALLVNGKLVAAVEEERLIRKKHARGHLPIESARWCLESAGINASEIDVIAFPYAAISLANPARWHYAKRHLRYPDRILKILSVLFNGNRLVRKVTTLAEQLAQNLGCDLNKTAVVPVVHHLAHASSTYHFSGFTEKTAIIGIDGMGEYSTAFFGYGENGKIYKIKEFYYPDSLGLLYSSFTEYLGFDALDGEFRVMGMAPYGDPNRYDLSRLMVCNGKTFKLNTKYVNCSGRRRYKNHEKRYSFGTELVNWLGPKRESDEIDEPYIHYAASLQKMLEDTTLKLVDYHLGDIIRETGKVCLAGGVALNVKLNQRILELPYVKELFVQPAANDPGTAIGAASFVANERGEQIKKFDHVYLGPSYSNEECITACQNHPRSPKWQKLSDAPEKAAEILANGNPLAWFQGRMEFGPRALGNRSILGDPSYPGIADRINSQIKYRERWRPFCPSLLDRVAKDVLASEHPAPYMTITFNVAPHWHSRIPEVVHKDGTARPQVVTPETNPRYYALIEALERKRGIGVILNTSLNRRGEPIVCSPQDVLDMFYNCDLEYLIMEDILVTKSAL